MNTERIKQRLVAFGVTIVALVLAGCASGPSTDLAEGWELMLAEDYATARDHYEAMLVEYPENPYAHLNLGVAYQRLGETGPARRHYEAAVEHGGSAEVTRVAEEEGTAPRTTTVAELARQNLQSLGD